MMQGQMITIKPDGKVLSVDLTAVPDLDTLQAAVGGDIEQIPGFSTYGGTRCVAFGNEEGKFKRLPYNHPAQKQWEQNFGGRQITSDHLVGDIIVLIGDDEFMDAL